MTAPLFDRNFAGFCPACGVNRKEGEEHSKACALFPQKPVRSRRLPWPPDDTPTDKRSTDGNQK